MKASPPAMFQHITELIGAFTGGALTLLGAFRFLPESFVSVSFKNRKNGENGGGNGKKYEYKDLLRSERDAGVREIKEALAATDRAHQEQVELLKAIASSSSRTAEGIEFLKGRLG